MRKRKNIKEIKKNMIVDRDNYMSAFRKNIFSFVEDKEITLNQISEEADIPFSTLKTFLYNDTKDCNLSTAVKLARAFGISIDRLVGAGTIEKEILDMTLIYKELPKSSQSLIKWHIQDQYHIHQMHKDQKLISVMNPICNCNGNLKKTNDYEKLDITNIGEELLHKVFFGIKIPCEHYLPHYKENDILLLANDRNAMKSENTVVLIDNNIIITRRTIENGVVKYYGIRDGIYRSDETDYVEVIGYIAKVISE